MYLMLTRNWDGANWQGDFGTVKHSALREKGSSTRSLFVREGDAGFQEIRSDGCREESKPLRQRVRHHEILDRTRG